MAKARLIIGLGNPGAEHADTYHNVGRLFLDYLADGVPFESTKYGFGYLKSGGMILTKSEAFMNQSGEAVQRILEYWKVPQAEALIVHDDSDLRVGEYKLSVGRGAAGHHGAESVIAAVGDNLTRLRIGIRPQEEERRAKAGEFVLKKISPQDRQTFIHLFSELKTKLMVKE